MNILIFTWRDLKHSWAGGSEIYVFEIAKRWVKMGNTVTVICGNDPEKNLPEKEIYEGINVIRLGGRFTVYPFAFWYYISKLRGKFDAIVDVQNGIPFFTPLFVRTPKIAYVFHIHGKQFFYEFPFPFSNVGFFIERYVFPFIYRGVQVVAISKTTKEELKRMGFKNNVSIVYCGINSGSKENKMQEKFSRPTILYLGRIKAYKRIDRLLHIFSRLLTKIPDLRLIIAGWGTEASTITDQVMKSPNRRKIELWGPVSEAEKKNLLGRSWIFVNPSIGEGWSIAVIEANYYGTPAVGFNVSGLSESIRDGQTGYLADDEEDMFRILQKIMKNEALRKKLSLNAWEWGHSFSWDKAARETMNILTKETKK